MAVSCLCGVLGSLLVAAIPTEAKMSSAEAYRNVRTNGTNREKDYHEVVDDRPYYPNLMAHAQQVESIREVTCTMLGLPKSITSNLQVEKVSGGITNQLFRVQGLATAANADRGARDSILFRIFGGEGLIDRDIDTSHFAALCEAHLFCTEQRQWYGGRFGNGRVEGWLEDYRAAEFPELQRLATGVATQTARLHALYRPSDEPGKPELWTQLDLWFQQARERHDKQDKAAAEAEAALVCPEFHLGELHTVDLPWLQSLVPSTAAVAFCHNDLLAANIMLLEKSDQDMEVQLIDFEYGGWNYVAYDIANHWNEYAGGTDASKENGVTRYELFPTPAQQEHFLRTYVQTQQQLLPQSSGNLQAQVEELSRHVQSFVMVNHLYWGLWAWNQAAIEGCEHFHYMRYAKHRMQRYYHCKRQAPAK